MSHMEAVYRFDGHELDLQLFELRSGGEPCHLEPQVFEVLSYLVRNHDRLVTKQELMDHVWPDSYVSEAALNTRIMAARKAIGDNGRDQRLIRTVHGRGFRFVAEVSEGQSADDDATSPVALETPPLPAQPDGIDRPESSLVGRAAELAVAEELLARPGCRLITVLGPGGVGKTRFAFELGTRRQALGEPFVWIPLEPIHQASDLPPAIAAAIGLPAGTADATEDLVRRLADRRLLLILDNAEQVASGVGELLAAILTGAPGVRALVTSRVVLGLRDEWVFTLGGLALDEDSPGQSEAAQLLIARAAQADAAGPGFGPEDLEAVSEICRLVDGMPLAIELAASLCRFLRPALLASLIRTNLDTLEADLAYVPQRHRSIPSLLAESCSRLDERQRRPLFALAVFEAPFTVEAAGAVAGSNLAVLRALVDRSLLHVDSGRFSLHPLMRQYAQEQLGPAGLEELRPAHADYFLGMLANAADGLEGGEQVAATRQLDAEFVNITTAWRWACAERRIDLIEGAALPLAQFIQFRARFREGDGLMEVGIKAVETAGDEWGRLLALLLVNSGWILVRVGRGYEAVQRIDRAAETLKRLGQEPLGGIGTDPMAARAALAHTGARYDDATALALESASRAGKREDMAGRAFGLWLGGSAMMRKVALTFGPGAGHEPGTYAPDGEAGAAVVAEASKLQDEASTLLAAIGDRWLLAFVEMERAVLSSARGDFHGSSRALENAYRLRREFNDPMGMASALISYADALVDLRELDEAEPRLNLSYQLIRDLGEASMMSEVMRSFATLAMVRGDLALALERAAESMRLARSVGFKANIASALRLTGEVLHIKGDYESALNLFAFVVLHPGGSAFSTAKAKASIRCLEPLLDPADVARAWERAGRWDMDELAVSVARYGGTARPLLPHLPA